MRPIHLLITGSLCLSFAASAQVPVTPENGYALGEEVPLPEPYATQSADRRTTVIGWPEGTTPQAPKGFTVKKFAGDLKHPRWIYILPNDDVLVAESDDAKKAAPIVLLCFGIKMTMVSPMNAIFF